MPIGSPAALGLRAGHYAFMRAVVQGLDWRESWQRYLAQDEVPADAQAVRSAIERIRWAFAAAARRARRPGLARLVLLDAAAVNNHEAPRPTLEDFAMQAGLEDFSYQEQSAAYEAHFGPGLSSRRELSRRARLVARQLEALSWLESHSSTFPIDGDPIADWLAPALCDAMGAVGIETMGHLKSWIGQRGEGWTQPLRAVGPVKGRRLLAWLEEQGSSPMAAHSPAPRVVRRGAGSARAASAHAATGVRPLELYRPPPALSAVDDVALIVEWVASIGKVTACGTLDEDTRPTNALELAHSRLSSTQRCYRREAERLLLWSHLVRGCGLLDLTQDACVAYLDFLHDPVPRFPWCGPRGGQRWSASWRPFEGPLSAAARQQSLVILRGLFRYLQSCEGASRTGGAGVSAGINPWDGVAVLGGRPRGRSAPSSRTLPAAQGFVEVVGISHQPDLRNERACVGLLCRREFGLRLRETVQLTWNDLDSLIGSRERTPATRLNAGVATRYREALVARFGVEAASETSLVFPKLPQVAAYNAQRRRKLVDPIDATTLKLPGAAITPSALCQDMRRLAIMERRQSLSV